MGGITFILFGPVECQMLSEFLFVCFSFVCERDLPLLL